MKKFFESRRFSVNCLGVTVQFKSFDMYKLSKKQYITKSLKRPEKKNSHTDRKKMITKNKIKIVKIKRAINEIIKNRKFLNNQIILNSNKKKNLEKIIETFQDYLKINTNNKKIVKAVF